MPVKLCVIGCGGHANATHIKALKEMAAMPEGPVLAGCCDISLERATAFKENGGFAKAYTDFEVMIASEKPDGVLIATPFTVTPGIAAKVALLKVPALIEKPPAETLEGCMPIVDALKIGGGISMVAFNRRHMPLVADLKEIASRRGVTHIDYSMYRVRRTERHFHTTAIHGIDMIAFIAGSRYTSVRFWYQDLPALGAGVSNLFMDAVFESGASARLSFIVASGRVHERMLITGDGYTAEAALPMWDNSDAPGYIRVYEGDKLVSAIEGEHTPMYVSNGFLAQLQSFVEHIKSARRSPNDMASALQSVEIAECMGLRKASYTRQS